MYTKYLPLATLPGGVIDADQQARLFRDHRLEVAHHDGWLQISLHAGRQSGVALMALVVAMACLGASFLMPAPDGIWYVIRVVSGCFGASLLVVCLYLPFNALDVQISRQKLKRVRRWFGVRVRAEEIRAADLDTLRIEKGPNAAPGSTSGPFELIGSGSFGRIKLVENFPDRDLLEAIQRLVMQTVGLRPSGTH